MTGRIRFTEAAEVDIDDAAAWYAAQRPELSVAFLQAVDEVVVRIAANPFAFPLRIDDVRRANLPRRWPYSLWFMDEPDGSVVIAALHQRRNPAAVKQRKPEP